MPLLVRQLPRAPRASPMARPSINRPVLPLPSMRGDEERVVAAYASWLERNGWTVSREVEFVDFYAERGQEKLYARQRAGPPRSVQMSTPCTASC